jgi:PAS domain S-box-containing protein
MSKTSRFFEAWLEQPSAGAAGMFRGTLSKGKYPRWAGGLFRHTSLILIAVACLVSLLPFPNEVSINVGGVLAVLGLYTLYLVVMEVASRRRRTAFDRVHLRVIRIAVNVVVVSALLCFSTGRNYLWLLYLLPICQAIVYFSLPFVLGTAGAVLTFYWGTACLIAANTDATLDPSLHFLNSVELLLTGFAFYVLVWSAREDNRLKYKEMEALRQTALALTSELEVKFLLENIIQRAVTLLRADGGGIYRYDRGRGELTVVADSGAGPSLVGYTLKEGEGMAGRVVQTGKALIVPDYKEWAGQAPNLEATIFRAVIEVPLGQPDDILGVLYVTHHEEGKVFSARDAQLLSLLASHAAIAMRNAEAFEKNEKTLRHLELLHKINDELGNAFNLEQILQITLQEVLKAVRVNEGSVMMVDQKTGMLEIRAWVVGGRRVEPKGHKLFSPDEGIAGYVASTGKPCNCPDTSQSEHFVASHTGRRIGALLSVPIFLNERVYCVINADSKEPHHFTEADTELLSALAVHVAAAIESQRLRDLGIALSTDTLEELYPKIVENACVLTGAQVSTIFLVDEPSEVITRAAFHPPSIKVTDDRVRDDGLTRRIIQTGQLLSIPDVQDDPHVKPSIKSRGVQSMMGVPLTVRSENHGALKTIGVLFVSTTHKRRFGKRNEEVLQSLANQAAIVIEKSRNVETLKQNMRFKESLLASAFDAIIAVDEEQRVVVYNSSAERTLGYTHDEVIGRQGNFLINPEDGERIQRSLDAEGKVVNFYTKLRSKAGDVIPIRLSVARMERGVVGFFRDLREIESAKRHIQQLHKLFGASQAITELDTFDAVLDTTVVKTIETLGADVVSLYHYDAAQDRVELSPVRRGRAEEHAPADGEAIIRRFINEVEIHFADDAQQDEVLGGDFVRSEGIRSAVGCTLRVRGKAVGVIFCSYREPHTFTPEEQAMMRLYFSGAAVAIENARLYAEVSRHAQVIDGLYKAGLVYTADLKPEAHLGNLLAQARRLTNAQYAALEIRGTEWKPEPVFISSGVNPVVGHDTGQPPGGNGVPGMSQKSGAAVQLAGVAAQPGHDSFLSRQPQTGACLSLPLSLGSRSIGKFYVANKLSAPEFNKNDKTYLSMLAGQAAMVVERAQAQEEAKAVQTINVAFLLLSVWARRVWHRSRECRELIEHPDRDPRIDLEGTLATVKALVDEMVRLPDTARFKEESKLNCRVNFSQLLKEVALKEEFQQSLDRAALAVGITGSARPVLEIEPLCMIKGSPLLLRAALDILIENAIQAIEARQGLPISLQISCRTQGGQVHVTIADSGEGIPPAVRKDLFKVPLNGERGNFGYGSVTADMIFKVHRGNLWVECTGKTGTEIKLRLPAAT